MSAVAEIEAAIENLAAFQFPETWSDHYSVTGDDSSSSIIANDGRVPVIGADPNYAVLICMLHRTIAAQLAILRTAASNRPFYYPGTGAGQAAWTAANGNALDLARAINGTA